MPLDMISSDLAMLSNAEIWALALSRPGVMVLLRLEALMMMRIEERDRLAQPVASSTVPVRKARLSRQAKISGFGAAKAAATLACFAECRPSNDGHVVHLGDWFDRSIMVDCAKLAREFGLSPRVGRTGRVTMSRTITQSRVPLPEYWPEAWQDRVCDAILAGGPAPVHGGWLPRDYTGLRDQ